MNPELSIVLLCVTDCKRSLVGVGMVLQEDPSSVPILDKGMYNTWLKVCRIIPEFRILNLKITEL